MSCVHRLRAAAIDTWQRRDASGIDVSAIEHMDARCLALLREDGVDRLNAVSWPEGAAMILLVTLELPSHMTPERAFEDIGRANGSSAPDSPLGRFCAILAEHAPPERVQLAVPGDRRRATEFLNVREAVPAAVNRRVGRARQQVDARIEKTAADVIVPLDRFDELLDFLDAELIGRALDGAVWGHVSDGNVHPNVLPRSFADVESGRQAILALGREAIRIGGAPLAEHGVGRNQVKQQLLAELYGHTGIEDMRRVKAAIDPQWKLAPGVIFSV
jgi:D-lactate dehydrogenase (cytochrome)